MLIARVIGEMVSTHKHSIHLARTGAIQIERKNISIDASPIDMTVVGVIDRIDLHALAQTPPAHRE
jgi:microcompartment protein CcmK/EutM